MKKIFSSLFFSLFLLMGFAQNKNSSPCASNPVYRQFDFWVGEWEAFGPNGKKGGDSRIERILDSCVIVENWTSSQGGYSGKSYNTFNGVTGKWQQYWVDNSGGVTAYLDGHYENDKMILLTDNEKQKDETYKLQRLTFYHLSDDKVRQHGESSVDGGKTWKTNYDLEYRRKK